MRRCSGLDSWVVPAWSLKNWEVFWIGLDLMVTVLLSASVEIVGVSRSGIFLLLFVLELVGEGSVINGATTSN